MNVWRVAVALAVLGSAGCGPETSLSGSLSEVFPLEVSRVEVHRNDEAFQVTYFYNRNVFLDVVVRLAVSTQGVDLSPGKKIPLEGEYAPGHPRASISHAPGGEPVRLLPTIKKGDLTLSGGGLPGQLTSGSFSVAFESTGGDLGQGRTLTGRFSSKALDAGFGPLP